MVGEITNPVCSVDGVSVAFSRRYDRWVHTDEIDEKVEPHDVKGPVSRQAYLFEKTDKSNFPPTYPERQTLALERIAAAAERIASRLDS